MDTGLFAQLLPTATGLLAVAGPVILAAAWGLLYGLFASIDRVFGTAAWVVATIFFVLAIDSFKIGHLVLIITFALLAGYLVSQSRDERATVN